MVLLHRSSPYLLPIRNSDELLCNPNVCNHKGKRTTYRTVFFFFINLNELTFTPVKSTLSVPKPFFSQLLSQPESESSFFIKGRVQHSGKNVICKCVENWIRKLIPLSCPVKGLGLYEVTAREQIAAKKQDVTFYLMSLKGAHWCSHMD